MSAKFVDGNRVELLRSGAEYFPALITAIDSAQTEILIETYIFADDATGRAVADAMICAVRRGVNARLVIDGFGSKDHVGNLETAMRDGGVNVAVFRPERNRFSFRKSRLRRMHRKLVVVDERTAFVGGINIIDDLNAPPPEPGTPPFGPRLDFAVRVHGAVIAEILASMRAMWRQLHSTRRDRFKRALQDAKNTVASTAIPETQRQANAAIDTFSHRAAFVYRDNLQFRRNIEEEYLDAINAATRDIVISNAYFFPGREFRLALNRAQSRGVRVRLLLQGRKEYFLQHYACHALYESLIEAGLEIFEHHDGFLHAKVAVIDDAWATVGSSNIDPFSLLLAREANVFVRDAEFSGQLRQSLEAAIGAARVVRREHWRQRRGLDRLLTGFAYQAVRLMMKVLGYGYR
jgi:cardiolipin synthase A/B